MREGVGQAPLHNEKVRGHSEIKVPGGAVLNIPNSPRPGGLQRSEIKADGRYITRNRLSCVTLESYFHVPGFPHLQKRDAMIILTTWCGCSENLVDVKLL